MSVSDANGYFTINVPEGKVLLVFSYIGYKQQEVEVKDSKTLAIVMEEDVVRLEEVVVTTGYATQKKSCVTGSVASAESYSPPRDRRVKSCYQPAPDYNTEGYSAIHENGYKNPLNDPLSTFSIDVDAASYSNVRRFITEGQKPVPDAVRIEEMINYFDYDYPQPHDGNPFAIVHELGACPWNKDNLLLHIGLQGEKMTEQMRFLLQTWFSCSMFPDPWISPISFRCL